MHIILILLVIIAIACIIYLPHYWVQRVIKKHKRPEDVFPGTGGELARHLLDRFDMKDIKVEETDPDTDHYDPQELAVRLSPDIYNGRSLSAITIAAHEVGHAIQHNNGYGPFRLRTALVLVAGVTEKLGSVAIMLMPVAALATRSPQVAAIMMLLGIAAIAIGTLVHLVTLPVEWNASFGRALPILSAGEYIDETQYRDANTILKAAALTYVAGSLASLLNLYRWIAILRR